MRPRMLRELKRLADAGAAIYGDSRKPVASLSMQDYPRCDEEVQQLATDVWKSIKTTGLLAGLAPDIAGHGNCSGVTAATGGGRIFSCQYDQEAVVR